MVASRMAQVLLVAAVAAALMGRAGDEATFASATGDFVLVTEWGEFGGSGVAKIDPATDQIIARAAISGSPRHIAADQARRLAYVSLHYADKVAALKVDTLEVADLTIPGLGRAPIGVTLTPDGLTLLVATRGSDGTISADDRLDVVALNPASWPPTASLVTSISTGLHPIQAIVDRTGRYAVVTVRNRPAILIVDLATYQIVWQAPNLPPDAEPEGGDAHPSQNVVYVTLHGRSTIEVINLDLLTITQHVPITNSTQIPTQPSTVRFTPDGSRAYVSGQTVNRVLMFDTSDPRNPVQNPDVELPVGPQPHHIVWLPGDRAYVANTNNMQPHGSLSVISNYSGVPSVSGPILTDLAGPLSFAYFEAPATPVGGIAELPDVGGSGTANRTALAALSAAALLALTAGAWYARRRWLG
jgi:DNA-binding beta-propeller fold protein YncE